MIPSPTLTRALIAYFDGLLVPRSGQKKLIRCRH